MHALREVGLETFELDVTKAESIALAYAQVERLTGGKLDVLVNNAYVMSKTRLDFVA